MVTGRASFFTAMAWMQCQQGGASKVGALCVFQCSPQEKTEKAWLGLIPSCPILTFKTKAAWKNETIVSGPHVITHAPFQEALVETTVFGL